MTTDIESSPLELALDTCTALPSPMTCQSRKSQTNYTTSLALCPSASSKPDDQRQNPDPAENAKPKVVKEALGHSSVAFTMDTYSHVIGGMQEDVIALLDDSWFLFR